VPRGALSKRRWICVGIPAVSLAAWLVATPAHADDPSDIPAEDELRVVEVKEALDAAREQLRSGENTETLPFADGSDWLRTTSGEWVRGNIDWMREDVMSFDSAEFGELEINMREVAEIHAATINTYLLDDRTTLIGPAMITRTKLAVETPAGVVVRPRRELWSIVEGGGREVDYWSAAFDLGLALNRGNSNQVDMNLRVGVSREDKRTLTELVYMLNLGYADREVNVSRHVLPFSNRVWLTRIWYVEPIVGQLLSDKFQDIRFRAQPAATAGVRFLHIPSKALWDLAVGFGYQYLRLFDPFVGVENPQHDGLTRFQTRARFDLTPDIALVLRWVTNLTFTTVGNTNHTGFSEFLFEITNVIYLQAAFLYLRTEEPKPRFDGTLPSKNDYFFTIGISLQLG
jgi:hypothetical protein